MEGKMEGSTGQRGSAPGAVALALSIARDDEDGVPGVPLLT